MTRRDYFFLLLIVLVGGSILLRTHPLLGHASSTPAPSPPPAGLLGTAPGPAALVRLESSDPVFDVLYRYGQVTAAPSGAYGADLRAPRSAWYLEEQRAGNIDIYDGVLRDDPSLITEGLRIFHYGLARQAPDGSFPGSAWPFHGTALFLAEAAPSLIFLDRSRFAGRYNAEVRWQIDRIQRAAVYMVHKVGGPGHIDDYSKNHRWFEAALALGATGIVSSDHTLVTWSHRYARRGVQMQQPDGVMPENGGHDSGYQSVGMSYATQYTVLLGRGSLRTALVHALTRGEAWELSRVRPDGSIDQTGDRRTLNCVERGPNGECKSVFAIPIAGALGRWATVIGSQRFAAAAESVWARATNSKPPPAS